MLIVLSDGIIQSGYLSIEVNTENHTQFEDQSVSMYVRICPLKPANQLVDVVISFCCKWFQLQFGLPQLVFQLPTPFKLYSSSISTQEQFLWSVPLILWTSWSEYWKKESQLMLANLIILFQLHKRVHHLGFFSVIPSLSPQSKRSVQSCKQWKGHRERERERERSPHLGKNLLHSLHNFIAYVVYIIYGHDFQLPRTHQGDLESCSIPYHGAWVAQPPYNLRASMSDNQQTNPPSSRCNQSL